jgi:hypothetical protein
MHTLQDVLDSLEDSSPDFSYSRKYALKVTLVSLGPDDNKAWVCQHLVLKMIGPDQYKGYRKLDALRWYCEDMGIIPANKNSSPIY